MNLCMSDFRKQIRRQILGDLIDEGKTGREARAIPHANRKQRREVRFYLNGKIEYDAMTGQTETDRGRRQQNRWPDLSAWIKERCCDRSAARIFLRHPLRNS
jgi:hypothetical protein